MGNSSEYANPSAPSTAATLHSLIDSVRGWLDSFHDLIVLEGKKAGIGLTLMLGFGGDKHCGVDPPVGMSDAVGAFM